MTYLWANKTLKLKHLIIIIAFFYMVITVTNNSEQKDLDVK